VASVHPEPGSNSSLLFILFFFFSEIYAGKIFLKEASFLIPRPRLMIVIAFDKELTELENPRFS
ncbi:MAG: hypothetical protein K2H03_09030, partial [Muribaculaceae bacterium]|nr:hypothetical protein [Muribaculaceae bacterium]